MSVNVCVSVCVDVSVSLRVMEQVKVNVMVKGREKERVTEANHVMLSEHLRRCSLTGCLVVNLKMQTKTFLLSYHPVESVCSACVCIRLHVFPAQVRLRCRPECWEAVFFHSASTVALCVCTCGGCIVCAQRVQGSLPAAHAAQSVGPADDADQLRVPLQG